MQVLTIRMQILTIGTHLGTNPQHNHRDASFNHQDADINRQDASGHQSSIRQICLCQNVCFYPTHAHEFCLFLIGSLLPYDQKSSKFVDFWPIFWSIHEYLTHMNSLYLSFGVHMCILWLITHANHLNGVPPKSNQTLKSDYNCNIYCNCLVG